MSAVIDDVVCFMNVSLLLIIGRCPSTQNSGQMYDIKGFSRSDSGEHYAADSSRQGGEIRVILKLADQWTNVQMSLLRVDHLGSANGA